MKKVFKYMTFYDKILIIMVLIISISFIVFPFLKNRNLFSNIDNNDSKNTNKYVVIQSKNKIVQKISLDRSYNKEPIIIEVKGNVGTSKIEINQGKVRIKKAPPADPMKVCEKTGWISSSGPSIICVPNQITVWIETRQKRENEIDGVTW